MGNRTVVISLLSFFAVGAEKDLELRDSLEIEYGIEREQNDIGEKKDVHKREATQETSRAG